ncbi:MAG TPA: Gfo/Idh/MocA family oxidoreductase [Bacillota bacterium]|nr:Gfo/Idh/MocA family oxidoreductase [Bacillota bacterium]
MKKNLAVVGYGGMGGWHAEHARHSDVVNLVGVYDIKPERNELARSRGIHAYNTFEELLADPNVEIITIATPNDSHCPIAVAALEAGKHVICEKPVTVSSALLEKMIDAAKRNNRIFTVHQNRRWDHEILAVKELKEKNDLGYIFNVESRVHGSRGIPGDWRGKKEHGGGMLLDWGVHLIDQAIFAFPDDPIVSIYARLDHITNQEVDDGCRVIMKFESGLQYYVEVGTSNFISLPRFYVQGVNGTAVIQDWGRPIKIVTCNQWLEENVTPIKAAQGITKTMAPRDDKTITTYERPLPQADVHDFYRNVCKAIDGIEPQLVTHDQIRRVMKVMEAAFESDRTGEAVRTYI